MQVEGFGAWLDDGTRHELSASWRSPKFGLCSFRYYTNFFYLAAWRSRFDTEQGLAREQSFELWDWIVRIFRVMGPAILNSVRHPPVLFSFARFLGIPTTVAAYDESLCQKSEEATPGAWQHLVLEWGSVICCVLAIIHWQNSRHHYDGRWCSQYTEFTRKWSRTLPPPKTYVHITWCLTANVHQCSSFSAQLLGTCQCQEHIESVSMSVSMSVTRGGFLFSMAVEPLTFNSISITCSTATINLPLNHAWDDRYAPTCPTCWEFHLALSHSRGKCWSYGPFSFVAVTNFLC
jgi:hypothetical protein